MQTAIANAHSGYATLCRDAPIWVFQSKYWYDASSICPSQTSLPLTVKALSDSAPLSSAVMCSTYSITCAADSAESIVNNGVAARSAGQTMWCPHFLITESIFFFCIIVP